MQTNQIKVTTYHFSKYYFALVQFVAGMAFLIFYSDNAGASVSDHDSNIAQPVYTGDTYDFNGYKSVKFGMNAIKLKSLGYGCQNKRKTICRSGYGIENSKTLRDKETKSMVWIDDKKVSRIDVSVSNKPSDVMKHYKASLGDPLVFRYISLTNKIIEAYYWVSPNGSSISVARDFGRADTTIGEEVEKELSTVKYQNKYRTLKSIQNIKQRKLLTGKS